MDPNILLNMNIIKYLEEQSLVAQSLFDYKVKFKAHIPQIDELLFGGFE